jgi:hypothetical protein
VIVLSQSTQARGNHDMLILKNEKR